jgi:PKD repeat protein
VTRFDATASDDPDGRVARYDWDFGDGTVLPNGGPTPTHSYTRPGIFRVGLTVTDDEGCSDHQVFTGQSTLCNGSSAARMFQAVVRWQ